MNNIDYQNLIETLKKALEFYANGNNYPTYFGGNSNNSHGSLARTQQSRIELDGGHQARFALQKIKDTSQFYEEITTEYLDEMKKRVDETDDIDSLIDTMKELKNIKNIITNKEQ